MWCDVVVYCLDFWCGDWFCECKSDDNGEIWFYWLLRRFGCLGCCNCESVMIFEKYIILVVDIMVGVWFCGWMIGIVEFCIGGLILVCFIEVLGLFDVFDWGFVIYLNGVKCKVFGVFKEIFICEGVVSEVVVCVMVEGVFVEMLVSFFVVVIGIVGLIGGLLDKLVGIVYMVSVCCDGEIVYCFC